MNKPDRLIQKSPFNGSDKHLIDSFYIVGYEESFINDVIIPNLQKEASYQPCIIDSITSCEVSKNSNENLYIKLIYPKNPEVISPNYPSLNNSAPKDPTNVIFSFSFDNVKGTSVSSYSGYGFLFYELFQSTSSSNQTITAYIPKAFVIISKFPFFTVFKTICKNVHQYFTIRKPEMVPIEVILYNIVNYTPCPLNSNLTLDFFPHDVIQNKVTLFQLSGYPLVDFDLSQIFTILSVNFVLEIFLFSLFEIDMLFFSKNLELLNMVMYIIYILNYPCNDTIYLWHIVSFSKEDFLIPNHLSGMFVDKLCTMIIGVNCTYDDSINPKQFKNYFVVDIDNKKMLYKTKDVPFKKKEENNLADDMHDLHKYFQRIMKDKSVESSFMEKPLRALINGLHTMDMESFFLNTSLRFSAQNNKQTNLFDFDENINKKNRHIQELFYEFYLKILKKLYSNYTISYDSSKSSFDDIEKDKKTNRLYYYKYDQEGRGLGKEEKLIMKLFEDTNKFSNFFINFVKYFIYKESFSIPLLFSEELINIKMYHNDSNTSNSQGLFDLIDGFYMNKQSHRFNLSITEKEIEYDSFYINFYNSLWNDYLTNNETKVMRLNRKLLFKYINVMNGQLDSLKEKMFPSYAILKSNSIKSTFSSDIIYIIEEGMTQMNLIDSESLIITSIVMIFSITQFSCPFMFSVTSFKNISSLITKHEFRRKYVFILLLGYYKIIKENKQNDPNSVSIARTNYYLLLNFILTCNIILNENMMTVMSLLKKEMELMEKEKKDETNKNEDDLTEIADAEFDLVVNSSEIINIKKEMLIDVIKKLKTSRSIEFNLDKSIKVSPRVRVKFGNRLIESDLYTPVTLKHMSENLFERYLATMKNELAEDKEMQSIVTTVLYYTKIFPQLEKVRKFLLKILEIINERVNKDKTKDVTQDKIEDSYTKEEIQNS